MILDSAEIGRHKFALFLAVTVITTSAGATAHGQQTTTESDQATSENVALAPPAEESGPTIKDVYIDLGGHRPLRERNRSADDLRSAIVDAGG